MPDKKGTVKSVNEITTKAGMIARHSGGSIGANMFEGQKSPRTGRELCLRAVYRDTQGGRQAAEGHDYTAFLSSMQNELGLSSYDHTEEDTLDLYAFHLIEAIQIDALKLQQLSTYDQFVLFRYFYKNNPVFGRIIDLHVHIPLSKMRLQAPSNTPEILKDYVLQFFNRIMDRADFSKALKDIVRDFFINGQGIGIVDDCYVGDNNLGDVEKISNKIMEYSEEDAEWLERVEKEYEVDPSSVDLKTRIKYLEKKFIGFFSRSYQGPASIRHVPFWKTEDFLENEDIGYKAIAYLISESLSALLKSGESPESLLELGYSEGMINILEMEGALKGTRTSVYIDNDHITGLPFIFVMEGVSLARRCIHELIEWDIAKRAFKAKIDNLGKVGRVVTSEDLGPDQIEFLRSEVDLLLADPGYTIVANFPINWEEVNQYVKDELQDLIDNTDKVKEELAIGLGFPDSLLSGDSIYSGDNIKLEILNTQYADLKFSVQDAVNRGIFRPIAMRKGLISVDQWGNPQVLHPLLSFSRISIRDESVYDLLFSLYQKGSLPIGILYEILNLDSGDIERGIVDDMFTPRDPVFNEIFRDIYRNAAEVVSTSTDVNQRIIEGMRLKSTVPEPGEEDEEGFDSGGGFGGTVTFR